MSDKMDIDSLIKGWDLSQDKDSNATAICFDNEIYVGDDLDNAIEKLCEATGEPKEKILTMVQRTVQSFDELGEAAESVTKSFKNLENAYGNLEDRYHLPMTHQTNHFYQPKRSKKKKYKK